MKIILLIWTLCFSYSVDFKKSPILKPNEGVGDITIGCSSLKDVQNAFGKKKIEKRWHKSTEFQFFGKFEYYLEYENIGLFSTLTNGRNRKIVEKIILNSPNHCKTQNGFGVGSTYQETIKELGFANHKYIESSAKVSKRRILLQYNNMDIYFDNSDSVKAKVEEIIIG